MIRHDGASTHDTKMVMQVQVTPRPAKGNGQGRAWGDWGDVESGAGGRLAERQCSLFADGMVALSLCLCLPSMCQRYGLIDTVPTTDGDSSIFHFVATLLCLLGTVNCGYRPMAATGEDFCAKLSG